MRVLLEDGFSVEKGAGVGRYTQNLANELGQHPEVEFLPQYDRGIIGEVLGSSTLKSDLASCGRQHAGKFSREHVVPMYPDAYRSSLSGR
jgi:hypothetical protein